MSHLTRIEKKSRQLSQRLCSQRVFGAALALLSCMTFSGTSAIAGNASESTPATVRLLDVRFHHSEYADRVEIEVSGAMVHSLSAPQPNKSRIELRGVDVAASLERVLDTSAFKSFVSAITTYKQDGNVIVEVDRANDASGELKSETTAQGVRLSWIFGKKNPTHDSKISGIAPDGKAAKRIKSLGKDPSLLPEESNDQTSAGAFTSSVPMQAARRFTGRRVDLDFNNADVHNILRMLADVGRVNIVTADDVAGSITIKMKNVPWDQALDVVLQSKRLGMVRTGNLIRVAKAEALDKERELLLAKRKQDVELAPLETRLIPVSYATASDLAGKAQTLKTPRGTVTVDDRTNVLIVRDVAGAIDQMEALARSLDTQTPEVLIESRIVEATSRYLREVGIQWGGDLNFSAATGNPTGLAFPNRMGLAGGASDPQTPTAGLSPLINTIPNPNFAVNLPAAVGTGSGGALGLTFGSINNVLNLNLRLSAAESSGMVRIISSPRILTLDNRVAKISQGTMIPFSQISAAGVNTIFQEARLALEVKPHVTAEGSISMHVKINRDEPDFNQTSARGDPTILKREAETDLLVADGDTVVIGGIYTRNTGKSVDQVPFFGSIPIIGILFQKRRASDIRTELVIFITPRIVNRAAALGR